MSKLTLTFKGRVLKMFPVLQGKMLVGQSPECTIHIDSLALEPRHAEIETSVDHKSILRDLGSETGTFVNQDRITEHVLKDGDLIRIGKHTLSYAFDAAATLAQAEEPSEAPVSEATDAVNTAASEDIAEEIEAGDGLRTAWLQILSGQNLGKTLSLSRSITNLGKPGVATAVIARRNDGYFISHLEGTVVPQIGDQEIGEDSRKLDDGDLIQIGNIKMQFYYE